MRSPATALALVMGLAAAPALAATEDGAERTDAGNREMNQAGEGQMSARDMHADWDRNEDRTLSEEEYTAGLFDAWDRDGDGGISRFEYDRATNTWASEQDFPPFAEVDTDEDKVLSQNEFGDVVDESDLYASWDASGDQGVDADEFDAALIAVWDVDEDGALGQDEYARMRENGGGGTAATSPDVVALSDWNNQDLYQGGMSVENLIGEDVYGATGDEIGEVEDVLFGTEGEALAVVIEVGGFIDIGDTHVSVPWNEVEFRGWDEGINVPLNEENVGDYGLFDRDVVSTETVQDDIVSGLDDATTPRAWRASELIGDYARIRDGESYMDYGYVDDLIVKDGKLTATVVTPDVGYGMRGAYAYPYYGYGYGYGWGPGRAYYDIPYDRDEVAGAEPFDYDAL